MPTTEMNNQVACKTVFNLFLCAAIGILATPIRAIQVCNIPPALETQTTNLTCKFDVDVTALKKEITVLRYDNNDPHNPDALLFTDCKISKTVLYSATFQGEIFYLTRPGFTIIGKVTDTLVLRVDRVTRDLVGIFECHILPSVAGDVKPCNFILNYMLNDVRDTSTYIDTTVKKISTDSHKGYEDTFPVSKALLIAVFIGILLALIAVVIILVIFHKRVIQKVNKNTKYTPANTGSSSDGGRA